VSGEANVVMIVIGGGAIVVAIVGGVATLAVDVDVSMMLVELAFLRRVRGRSVQ
jgi:hypothetical protein